MKNKGFTLIELLGVIIILALLMILVFPSIINSVKSSSNKTDELTKNLIYNATELFIDSHVNEFPKVYGNKYTIGLWELVDEGLLASPIKLSDSDEDITNLKCIEATYTNDYEYKLINCSQETIIPEGYQQVQYIISTGTQYIDMQYSYKVNDKINIEFMITKSTGAIQGVFGNGNSLSSGYKGVSVYILNSLKTSTTIGGLLGKEWYASENVIALNEKYNIKIVQNKLYLNNNLIITVENELGDGTQSDFSLFRRWGTNGMYGRIYEFNVERDSKLIFNLVPCYRVYDNVVGMYDTVNRVFYTNSGTGTFEKGTDI